MAPLVRPWSRGEHARGLMDTRRDQPRCLPLARRTLLAALPGLAASRAGAQDGRATIAVLGDVMLGQDVSAALRQHPPEWFWGDVLPVLQGADATIANLEGPLTRAALPQSRTPKWHHFRADPAAVAILRAARVRAVCLANNHVLDFGEEGLAETRQILAEARILAVGAGPDLAAAAEPAILDLPALRLGLVGATDALEPYAAGENRAGTHRIEVRPDSPALARLGAAAAALRARGAELNVLTLHWGPNFRRTPFDGTRHFAQAALAAGFDVIHGHSAHLLHGVEATPRGVVIYDAGNALDDYWPVPTVPQRQGCVFLLDIEQGRARRLRLVPVVTQPWPLRIARGRDRERILSALRGASARLGTAVRETAAGLEVPLSSPRG